LWSNANHGPPTTRGSALSRRRLSGPADLNPPFYLWSGFVPYRSLPSPLSDPHLFLALRRMGVERGDCCAATLDLSQFFFQPLSHDFHDFVIGLASLSSH